MFRLFSALNVKQGSFYTALKYLLLGTSIMCIFLVVGKLISYTYYPLRNMYLKINNSIVLAKESLNSQYHLANHLALNMQRLEKQVESFENQQNKMNKLKLENYELKSLLNFMKNDLNGMFANSDSKQNNLDKNYDNGNHSKVLHTFVTGKVYKIQCDVNKCNAHVSLGNPALVKKNDIVLSDKGIFGRVIEKHSTHIIVQLTTDNQSRIPVKDKSNNKGILAGNSQHSTHKILHLTSTSNDLGKIWYTDDGSSYYEKNIPVAKLISASDKQIIAEPIKRYNDIKFVSILLKNSI